MFKEYRVKASHIGGTYNAGKFIAETPQEACEMAREKYRRSDLGRTLKDVNSFHFYVVDKFDYEYEETEGE